jgi:hypothetical protein
MFSLFFGQVDEYGAYITWRWCSNRILITHLFYTQQDRMALFRRFDFCGYENFLVEIYTIKLFWVFLECYRSLYCLNYFSRMASSSRILYSSLLWNNVKFNYDKRMSSSFNWILRSKFYENWTYYLL